MPKVDHSLSIQTSRPVRYVAVDTLKRNLFATAATKPVAFRRLTALRLQDESSGHARSTRIDPAIGQRVGTGRGMGCSVTGAKHQG